jgi:D-3-phosphoglycerate dehydrogenase
MSEKPRVLVGVALHEDDMKRLQEVAEVDVVKDAVLWNRERLLGLIGDYDGVIIAVPPFDGEVIAKARKLKIISRRGVGYDNVDVQAAKDRGIAVTITPANAVTVADMAFALLLTAARRVIQAHSFVKNRRWKPGADRDAFLGVDVDGKTLGIIGLGRVGSLVARRGLGFDMKVLYYDVIRNNTLEKELPVQYCPLKQLLAEADFVSLHVFLSAETKGLIGEEELLIMKKQAILVNTSRGPVIDEKALYRALKEKWIAFAGLDVFEDEPIKPDNPLLDLENVVLTPHIAGTTEECRRRCSMLAVENTIRVLKGEKPLHPV